MLSEAEHQRIAEAVGAAEAGTTGEIVCVMAREVSNYREVPLAWAAAVALLAPLVALLLGADPAMLTPWRHDWTVGHAAAVGSALTPALETLIVAQVVLFALVAAVASIPPVRRLLTPSPLKRRRVHRAALQQFLATGLHLEAGRTGVVIFAAPTDRRVEILADDAIHAAVGDAVWNAAVAAVQSGMRRGDPAEGFVRAVQLCGDALAQHFPAAGPKPNAISDRLLEI
jgi:putative membrane protein